MINKYFRAKNAKSHNLEDYSNGEIPFVSNSSLNNGVVKYVEPIADNEIIKEPCVTVNGFGFATVQLKPFIGAGNGGVHIIALIPLQPMSVIELAYYAAQINLQSWRFSYGRRAIGRRLKQIKLTAYDLPKSQYSALEQKIHKKLESSFNTLFPN